jgi:sulfur relay (sulfurtransferase) complex TusBCD TusD component (DsrE family)
MEHARPNAMDRRMKEMIPFTIDSMCKIMFCLPCAEARGYSQEDPVDGVIIT